jgi:glycosyltransferase involved in cell wall biosynthesis
LLEAWPAVRERFPSARLALVGSVGARPSFRDARMKSELETFTEQVRLQAAAVGESVLLAGEVADPAPCYRAADAFVVASKLEGLPNAVLEAMACGLPCVLAPFEGFPFDGEEFGRPGDHFVPCAHSPASIAEALCAVLGQPGPARAIGLHARAWMEKTQALPHVLDRWAHAYRTVAGAGQFQA